MVDLVDQFIGITGCERDQATEILTAADFDLARAVDLFFSSSNLPAATSRRSNDGDNAAFFEASDTSPQIRRADPSQRIQMVPQNISTMYAAATGNFLFMLNSFIRNFPDTRTTSAGTEPLFYTWSENR
jgi:hypothetical protein